jgi:hypothetical protein
MSDESVILINLLKVKPEKRDALIALEAEHRHGDPHAARVKDDPADRGEGRRRPQASAFHAERPRFVLENSRRRDSLIDKLCGERNHRGRSPVLVGVWKRTPPTRQREGEIAKPINRASRRNCGALAAALRRMAHSRSFATGITIIHRLHCR